MIHKAGIQIAGIKLDAQVYGNCEGSNHLKQCMKFGQIITTLHDLTPNGGLVRESPQNPLNSGLGIILICPELFGLVIIYIMTPVRIPFRNQPGTYGWVFLQKTLQRVKFIPSRSERCMFVGIFLLAYWDIHST